MRLFSLIMAWSMVLVIFGAAALFTFSPFLEEQMDSSRRFWFVLVLWVYAAYRAYRLFRLYKHSP